MTHFAIYVELKAKAGKEEELANFLARQLRKAVDGADRAFDIFDDETRQPVVDHFRYRAAVEGNDGRAASHRR